MLSDLSWLTKLLLKHYLSSFKYNFNNLSPIEYLWSHSERLLSLISYYNTSCKFETPDIYIKSLDNSRQTMTNPNWFNLIMQENLRHIWIILLKSNTLLIHKPSNLFPNDSWLDFSGFFVLVVDSFDIWLYRYNSKFRGNLHDWVVFLYLRTDFIWKKQQLSHYLTLQC